MTNVQKAFCILLSMCFFATLAVLPGTFFTGENVYRHLPLYRFLEKRAHMSSCEDIETYKTLQESLYRSPAWRDMTECQQEAIVICSPNDPHFWLEHGVSIKVRNRAIAFMQKVQDISRSGQNPAVALASEYDKTYWYYYMFNMMDK